MLISYGNPSLVVATQAMARLPQALAMLLQSAEDHILLVRGASATAIANMNRDQQCLSGVV